MTKLTSGLQTLRAVGWPRRKGQVKHNLAKFGSRAYIDSTTTITSGREIEIEADVYIGPGGYIAGDGGLKIGQGVMVGPQVYIQTSTHNFESEDLMALPYDHRIIRGPIVLEAYVWVGGRVTILPGVRIGRGAVIGAGSVVTRDVDAFAIVAGNPARVIRHRDTEQFERLSRSGMTHREFLAQEAVVDVWVDRI